MSNLLKQLKKRRISLGFKQNDMLLRIGFSRQQYQRLESKGNPRLATLELIAKGLNSKLMLIPQEKLNAVLAVLENVDLQKNQREGEPVKSLSDDPWLGLIDDEG